jgi:demethylmenaquinone methyltransferase/2-methoxy-6-polyprenyl-1,4-benzoquinol methylase
MVAFGVRNFQNLQDGLKEMNRVLKPGGQLLVLEFSQPTKFPVKQLYSFYSRFVLPVIGNKISGDSAAYDYLPESVKYFPSGNDFASILSQCGFNKITIMPFTVGVVTLYTAFK